ncbi:radical SAM family heme chaperone HemW [Blautia sp. HCP3S3_H10_1]|uniref:radical SAM family heme chaperone HemW n=1 Tax=unclassified Blautia TaxID=2648079 RepID=UPI003F909B72
MGIKKNGLELYLHIPFCIKKCDYCDFLSGPATRSGQEAYIYALLREMKAASQSEQRLVDTVFIGGGTPSVPECDLMEQLLTGIRENFCFFPDPEVTIEANPGTLTPEKLSLYREYGINRLSIGLQSPKDGELDMLGRIHNYGQFLESYQMAREAGFSNINVDLMFAIPGQSYEGWIENLRTVAALEPEHISAYSLIVEEGTPFSKRQLDLPDEDTEYRMYEDVAAVLGEYGYHQYEISNYAKTGLECRHNEGYWQRKDYLGLGLGAASLLGKERFTNTADMQEYLQNSGSLEKIRKDREVLTREDEMAEFMFLGLRMTKGVSKSEFQEYFGTSIEKIYGVVLEKYKKQGLLIEEKDRIFLSREGIHVSNAVMADFLL